MRPKRVARRIGFESLGDGALVIRFRDSNAALAARAKIEAAKIKGVVEYAAAFNVLAVFYLAAEIGTDGRGDALERLKTTLTTALRSRKVGRTKEKRQTVPIGVCFDHEFGPDLAELAARVKMSETEAVELYCKSKYRVVSIGFTPGFPYLSGLPARLAAPRRDTPRREVAAGAVGIGGNQTGIYPMKSPGGWNIIGRTPIRLFDPRRNPPAVLKPGDEVRFQQISRDQLAAFPGDEASPTDTEFAAPGDVMVVRSGVLTTVQDLGRLGFRETGVSPGGALDLHALRVANLIAGNAEDAAGLEISSGGLRLRFEQDRGVAWTGGAFEANIPAGKLCRVRAGEEIVFGPPKAGSRAWLAISGGIEVPLVMGSRSTDLRSGFGGFKGRALKNGDWISLGQRKGEGPKADVSSWSAPVDWVRTVQEEPVLRVVRGSGWDKFDPSSVFALTLVHFEVTADSDRMGARLKGPTLKRIGDEELPSEPVAPGTIQVPPNGQPILLLGDCQTIGGYPKIAHVITVDLSLAAQLKPGDQVRFREVSLEEAHRLWRRRQDDLNCFRIGVRERGA